MTSVNQSGTTNSGTVKTQKVTKISCIVPASIITAIVGTITGFYLYAESENITKIAKSAGISIIETRQYEKEGAEAYMLGDLATKGITPEILHVLKERQEIGRDELQRMCWSNNLTGNAYLEWSNAGLTIHETNAHTGYGISNPETGALVKKVVPDFDFSSLTDQNITAKESVPLMVAGNSIDAVIKQYSDAVGITPEDRLTYVQQGFDTNNTITPLHEAGVTAQMLPNLRHNLTPELTLDLVDLDRLNGDIYNHWNSDEFMANEYTGLFIWRGYDREECKKWIPGGYTADQMDRAMQSGKSLAEMDDFTKMQWIMRAPEN